MATSPPGDELKGSLRNFVNWLKIEFWPTLDTSSWPTRTCPAISQPRSFANQQLLSWLRSSFGANGQQSVIAGARSCQGSTVAARAAADRPLTVHLSFQLRNPAALTKLLADIQDPASPQYHHWLTPQEFDARSRLAPES